MTSGVPGTAPATTASAGALALNTSDGKKVIELRAGDAAITVGGSGREGDVRVRDTKGKDVVLLNGGNGSSVVVLDSSKHRVLQLDDEGAGQVGMYLGVHSSQGKKRAGVIAIRDDTGKDGIVLNGGAGDSLVVADTKGRRVLRLDDAGDAVGLYVGVHSADGGNRAGVITVRDDDGNDSVVIDGANGDVILNNADLAEDFDLIDAHLCDAGTVVVIDGEGALRQSDTAYDRRVAGVISGAGDHRPAIVLDRQNGRGAVSDRQRGPIALSGKVFCKVDATFGAIAVGDLLTTSPTAGHAMRASDPTSGFGAVIGKALRPLASGTAMIPILVSLH